MGQNKSVVIIDHGMGNVRSVSKAVELLGVKALISNKKQDIERSERLILPGVGAFGKGMDNLRKFGLVELLTEQVVNKKKPILGICLGLQFMADDSEEFGQHKGLAWINGSVKIVKPNSPNLKVPHVGWNNIQTKEDCPLFEGIKQGVDVYFVHSFHLIAESKDVVAAVCDYGQEKVTAAIHKDNIFATQFHPEKSQTIGLKMLKNFLNYA